MDAKLSGYHFSRDIRLGIEPLPGHGIGLIENQRAPKPRPWMASGGGSTGPSMERSLGAVVTCGDLVCGIAVGDMYGVGTHRRAITFVPAQLLARDVEFRHAVVQASGEPLQLEPIGLRQSLLRDDSGYRVTAQDLEYLSISRGSIDSLLSGDLPLGFSAISYEAFVDDLGQALRDDGIDPREVDVRLKGSSTAFFAGRHKTLPETRSEIINSFRQLRGRLPQVFEIREIERRFNERWPSRPRPLRRPFDVMYTVGIDRVPSDYDLQLSSDAVVAKCEKYAEQVGLVLTRETTHHDVYNYIRSDLIQATMPHVTRFASLMSDALRRDVSIAVFESCGPPDLSAEVADLSSHFQGGDWTITCPGTTDESGQP
ncbi:hypothetical protein OG381_48120 [Streptomyces sp. NBC_00490]|uniref:hypothetical protein n=1 Tax=Streptomyces sp. NBC_00490 TaxID=2903657 RepID=UPI002E18A99F